MIQDMGSLYCSGSRIPDNDNILCLTTNPNTRGKIFEYGILWLSYAGLLHFNLEKDDTDIKKI